MAKALDFVPRVRREKGVLFRQRAGCAISEPHLKNPPAGGNERETGTGFFGGLSYKQNLAGAHDARTGVDLIVCADRPPHEGISARGPVYTEI